MAGGLSFGKLDSSKFSRPWIYFPQPFPVHQANQIHGKDCFRGDDSQILLLCQQEIFKFQLIDHPFRSDTEFVREHSAA